MYMSALACAGSCVLSDSSVYMYSTVHVCTLALVYHMYNVYNHNALPSASKVGMNVCTHLNSYVRVHNHAISTFDPRLRDVDPRVLATQKIVLIQQIALLQSQGTVQASMMLCG